MTGLLYARVGARGWPRLRLPPTLAPALLVCLLALTTTGCSSGLAVRSDEDPGAEFGLRFDGAAAEEEVEEEAPAPTGEVPEEGEAGARAPASVVSIDSFRRKGP